MRKTEVSSSKHSLFAEQFLVETRGGPSERPPIYDEEAGYSATSDGRPYVEIAAAGETRTASEVQAERDDADDDVRTPTTTFVEAEADDWEASFYLTRTETAVRGEQPEYVNWASTTTMTKLQNESEDRD